MQEEFVFFDDMLACAADNYPIEPNCVSSVGVSAGALWTAQLAGGRGEYLSSIVSLSGGAGGDLIKPWTTPAHTMPAFVLWGGPTDICVALNFENVSSNLEQALVSDGHSVLECVHNCGHSAPPFDAPDATTAFAPMWEYVLDHPYWLEDGESPWDEGLPASVPEWCRMGVGNATPRVGECGESAC
jgi:predicted esterase